MNILSVLRSAIATLIYLSRPFTGYEQHKREHKVLFKRVAKQSDKMNWLMGAIYMSLQLGGLEGRVGPPPNGPDDEEEEVKVGLREE